MVDSRVILGNKINNDYIGQNKNSIIRIPGISGGVNKYLSFDDELLQRDILAIGGIGSGKTNLLDYFVEQLSLNMHSEDVMLCFDPKCDFRKYHTDKDSVISNSYDGHTEKWNIFAEVVADGWDKDDINHNADEIAELIFNDAIKESHAPFFPKAAKDIFSAIVTGMTYLGINDKEYRLKFLNNKSLNDYIRKADATMLVEFLGSFPELQGCLKYIGDGKSEQALGVLAELQAVTNKLFYKNFGAEDARFSIRRYGRNRKAKVLFVEYDLANGLSLKPVYRVLIDLFLKEALRGKQKGKIYVVCDELSLIPKLSYLPDALNFGRSLGITVIAGLQSMEQLYETYGEIEGRNIASAFQTTVCFHTNNLATRDYIKGVHGNNVSLLQYVDSNNRIVNETRNSCVVEDWILTNLRLGEAVVGLPYVEPFVFKFERHR